MNRKKLQAILESGENLNVEFKQRFSSYEKIAKELIAFANTRGGYLIAGIEDDGTIRGVESEKSEAGLIKETALQYCEPPIELDFYYIEFDGREVVVAQVSESDKKPHRLQDYKKEIDLNDAMVYVRVNDKSIAASKEMIKILQADNGRKPLKNYTIGKNEKVVFEYLDKHEKITVKEFSKLVNISNRRASRTLIQLVRANLLLIHSSDKGEDYFTYAG